MPLPTPLKSTPLQNALRQFEGLFLPLPDLHDHVAGVSAGVVGPLALDSLLRAAGGAGLPPAVAAATCAACGGLGLVANLFLRVWRRERQMQEDEDAWAAEAPPDRRKDWEAVDDGQAERLTQRYGVPFPPGDALDWMELDLTALGDDPETRRLVLPLQGWRPWMFAIRTREPERTYCRAYLETHNGHGWGIAGFVGGEVRTFPVVGAELEPPCERGLSLSHLDPEEQDRLVVVVQLPPHTVARVRLYLTRAPGRHPEAVWEEEIQGGGEAA